MSLLTPEERSALNDALLTSISARAFDTIEAAVIKRLSAGVSVEPVGYIDEMDTPRLSTDQRKIALICCGGGVQLFTLSHLQTALAAARVQALEEAAQCMEEQDTQAPKHNAKAIRALIGGPK